MLVRILGGFHPLFFFRDILFISCVTLAGINYCIRFSRNLDLWNGKLFSHFLHTWIVLSKMKDTISPLNLVKYWVSLRLGLCWISPRGTERDVKFTPLIHRKRYSNPPSGYHMRRQTAVLENPPSLYILMFAILLFNIYWTFTVDQALCWVLHSFPDPCSVGDSNFLLHSRGLRVVDVNWLIRATHCMWNWSLVPFLMTPMPLLTTHLFCLAA